MDLDRLLEFTNGTADGLKDLVSLYLSQTAEQIEQLEAAVAARSASDVRRLAHSCAGASATCGMIRLVPILRELERQGAEEKLTNAGALCLEANREFQLLRQFLNEHLSKLSTVGSEGTA